MSKESTSNGGIGVFGLLGVAFIVLKLCGVINWSWWWVTCPLWGGIALLLVGFLLYLVYWMLIGKRREGLLNNKSSYVANKSNFQKRLEEMAEQRKTRQASNLKK